MTKLRIPTISESVQPIKYQARSRLDGKIFCNKNSVSRIRNNLVAPSMHHLCLTTIFGVHMHHTETRKKIEIKKSVLNIL